MKTIRIILGTSLAIAVAGLILATQLTRTRHLRSNVTHYANLGILDKDVQLGFVSTDKKRLSWSMPSGSNPWPLHWSMPPRSSVDLTPRSAMYLLRRDTCLHLTRLAQLRGWTHIDSPQDAAAYVHIPYRSDFEWQFSGADTAAELISDSAYKRLPIAEYTMQRSGLTSFIAVPDRTLQALHLGSLTASKYPGGWRVVRTEVLHDWVNPIQIETVQEEIGADGSYQRKVLVSIPLPVRLKPYVQPHGFM